MSYITKYSYSSSLPLVCKPVDIYVPPASELKNGRDNTLVGLNNNLTKKKRNE